MDIDLRDAGEGDEAAVVRLIRELAAVSHESTPLTVEYVRDYLATPGCHVLLAEAEARVIGLLSYSVRPNLYHAAPTGTIEELVVHAAWRGRGVGSALVEELLRRLKAAGGAEVSVTTMPENEEAQRFYRAHGLVDEAVYLEAHLGTS